MQLIDKINIERYHKDKIEKHGKHSPQTLGWLAPEGQITRFEVLSQIADLTNCSILDAGCGYGDLCGFLNSKFSGIRYFGVDLNESFLDIAIEKYGKINETAFFIGDFSQAKLPVTDYILLCGSLNYRNSDPHFIFNTLTKLFDSCRIAFGFNMLSSVTNPENFLVPQPIDDVLNHCKKLTPRVVLHKDYFENDFTIFMYC
jgi:SAM-dependent methyltransferase